MKIITAFILIVSVSACRKGGQKVNNSVVINSAIEICLKDHNGHDLLNPQYENSIRESEIKIFYVVDGRLKEINDTHKDYPRNFFVFAPESEYRMRLFVNTEEKEKITETVIQWNSSDVDTIRSAFQRTPGIIAIQKVWLNGIAVWPVDGSKDLYFTIIK